MTDILIGIEFDPNRQPRLLDPGRLGAFGIAGMAIYSTNLILKLLGHKE
jgi:hypothetical protein